MKITYDPTCSAFYVHIADEWTGHKFSEQISSNPMVMVDTDDTDAMVGVEILAGSLFSDNRTALAVEILNASYPAGPVNLSIPDDGTQGKEVRALYDPTKNIFYLKFREGACAHSKSIARSPEKRVVSALLGENDELLALSFHGTPDEECGIELCVFNYSKWRDRLQS